MALCRKCGRSRCCSHVDGPRSADGVTFCSLCQVDILKGSAEAALEAFRSFNHNGDNYESLAKAMIILRAAVDGKKPDLSFFESIEKMKPVDVLDLLAQSDRKEVKP